MDAFMAFSRLRAILVWLSADLWRDRAAGFSPDLRIGPESVSDACASRCSLTSGIGLRTIAIVCMNAIGKPKA